MFRRDALIVVDNGFRRGAPAATYSRPADGRRLGLLPCWSSFERVIGSTSRPSDTAEYDSHYSFAGRLDPSSPLAAYCARRSHVPAGKLAISYEAAFCTPSNRRHSAYVTLLADSLFRSFTGTHVSALLHAFSLFVALNVLSLQRRNVFHHRDTILKLMVNQSEFIKRDVVAD